MKKNSKPKSLLKSLFIKVLRICAIVYTTLFIGFYFFQKKMIFVPNKEVTSTPKSLRLDYQTHIIGQDKVHSWYIPAKKKNATTILICHGNAGNISNRLSTISFYRNALECNVMIFDYSGYGNTPGKVGEKATYQNSRDVFDFMVNDLEIDPNNIIVDGRSLGGAIAVDLAVNRKFKALILQSTFTSIYDMAKKQVPFFPISWVQKVYYDSISKIIQLECPTLVIHSREDQIIPYRMGEELYRKIKGQKQFCTIKGGHNHGWQDSIETYTKAIKDFMKSL